MWRFLNPAVTKEEVTYKDYHHKIPAVTNNFDVVLKVDGKSIKLHRNVLSATSNFFKGMFSADMMERKMKEIMIKAIEFSDFQSLVNFMYTGEIKISQENAHNLWISSDYLGIMNVSIASANFLTEQLKNEIRCEKHDRSFHDVLNIRNRANLLQCRHLYATTNKFIAVNFKNFLNSEEFKSINYDLFIDLIKSDDLIVHCNKNTIYEACMSWIEHDQKQRLPKKEEILAIIHHREQNHRKIFVYETFNGSFEIYDNLKEQQYTTEYSPRLSDSAVVMLGDIIYCCGGTNNSGRVVNNVLSYDPNRNIWKPMAPMIEERKSASAVALNGFIYVMGGRGNNSGLSLKSVERYDPVKECWEVVKPMNQPQSGFTAIVVKEKIYVCVNRIFFDCYDPKTNIWQMIPRTIRNAFFVCAVALNDYIYVLGVTDNSNISKSVERYDPERNCWEAVNPMINGGMYMQATVLQGNIYVCIGNQGNEDRSVEIYESAQDRWVEGSPMSSKHRFFNNNGVFHRSGSVKIYDPTTEVCTCEG